MANWYDQDTEDTSYTPAAPKSAQDQSWYQQDAPAPANDISIPDNLAAPLATPTVTSAPKPQAPAADDTIWIDATKPAATPAPTAPAAPSKSPSILSSITSGIETLNNRLKGTMLGVPEAAGIATAQAVGDHTEFGKGVKSALVGQNAKLTGGAAEAIGILTGSNAMQKTGQQWQTWGDKAAAPYAPRVGSVTNIRTDNLANFMSDLGSYAGYGAGQAIGSSAPSAAAGVGVSMLTENPIAGFVAGAALPSYVQNLGDVFTSAKGDKGIQAQLASGALSRQKLAAVSSMVAVPMAALDMVGLEKTLGAAFKPAKQDLMRRIVHGMVTGAISEGSTEGLQEVISQWAQSYLGSNATLKQQAISVVDNVLGGMFGGGLMGGAGHAMSQHGAVPAGAPNSEGPRGFRPNHGDWTPPATDAVDTAPLNQTPGQMRSDLESVLNDERPLDEIRAGQAADTAQAVAQQHGIPGRGQRGMVTWPDGEINHGTVLDTYPVDNGWGTQFRDDAGHIIDFSHYDAQLQHEPVIAQQATGNDLANIPRAVPPHPYQQLFADAHARYPEIPTGILESVAHVESRFNPKAVSNQGAEGMMQILPTIAQHLGVDPFNPAQAVDGAARILMENYRHFGNWQDAVAAYHGGWNKANWGPKTRAYVGHVLGDQYNPTVQGILADQQANSAAEDAGVPQPANAMPADDAEQQQPAPAEEAQAATIEPPDTAAATDQQPDVTPLPMLPAPARPELGQRLAVFDSKPEAMQLLGQNNDASVVQENGQWAVYSNDRDAIQQHWSALNSMADASANPQVKAAQQQFENGDIDAAALQSVLQAHDAYNLPGTNHQGLTPQEQAAATPSEQTAEAQAAGKESSASSQPGAGRMRVEPLGDKAIILKGDTRTHKEAIKTAGGRWNKVHGGWVFPKAREAWVRDQLGHILDQEQEQTAQPASSGVHAVEMTPPSQEGNWKAIGQNTDGETVYEDHRGVRSIVRNGIRATEPVALHPGGGFPVENRRDTYKTAAEQGGQSSGAPTLQDLKDMYIAAVNKRNEQGPVTDARLEEKIRMLRKAIDEAEAQHQADRRHDQNRRKAIEEMTPEEMRRELLTDALTGLGNRRAWEETAKLPRVASIDADGLKWVNDNLGHESGDHLLKLIGQALGDESKEAYHISGDEFIVQHHSAGALKALMERASRRLEEAEITVRLPDGSTIIKKGLGFSYGIGQNLTAAEHALKQHKAEREASGHRAPRGGEPAGVSRIPAEGRQDHQRETPSPEEVAPASDDYGTPESPNRAALAKRFAYQFQLYKGFKTIVQARQFAAEKLGGAIKPGTAAAKDVDEAVETGAVIFSRNQVKTMRADGATDKAIYDRLVNLYEKQMPTVGTRTSTSVAQQAYSTPVPLAFIASRLAGINDRTSVYEPTAGNGALLIEANPDLTHANELNPERREILQMLGIPNSGDDAAMRESKFKYDVVIENPPFGRIHDGSGTAKKWKVNDKYTTAEIDHAIVMKSLEAMKEDGHAVLIIGGVNEKTDKARSDAYNSKDKLAFFYTLYNQYNVVDHFTVSGKLYAKQGASFPVDVLVIRGRGKSSRALPAADVPRIYESFEQLGEVLNRGYVQTYQLGAPTAPGNNLSGANEASAGDRGRDRGTAGAVAGPGDLSEPAGRPAGNDVQPGGPGRGSLNVQESGNPGDRGQRSAQPGGAQSADVGQAAGHRRTGATAAAQAGEERPAGRQDHSDHQPGTVDDGADTAAANGGDGVSAADIANLTGDDFDALINEVLAEGPQPEAQPAAAPAPAQQSRPAPAKAPAVEPATAPAENPELTALLKNAASEGVKGAEESLAGLHALFGGNGRLGSGPVFDEETYAKAKPHFKQSLEHFIAAGRSLKDFIRFAIQNFSQKIIPYLRRFQEHVAQGIIQIKGINDRKQENKEQETEGQVAYVPRANGKAMGTLVPRNMKTAIETSLEALQNRVGPLDAYVRDKLGYAKNADMSQYFGAEQLDALALAIDNIERGAGFIIGDQTGIGKGRVVAGIIRYAIQKGQTPIFVTEKPNLYKDIYRDLVDIGMKDVKPIMTNSGETIPLDDDGKLNLKSQGSGPHNALLRRLMDQGSLGDYDVIFSTYNQMQTLKGARTARMDFLEAFANGGMVVFDESHNAGGTEASGRFNKKEDGEQGLAKLDRAAFARMLINAAHGVFYSSATYAKRPSVMSLYSATDMRLAVGDIKELGALIAKGGVPMQQVVAAMLAKAGQYIRRERSFAGVQYDTVSANVNKNAAAAVSGIMKAINEFDRAKGHALDEMDKTLKADARRLLHDGSTGGAGVSSTNFSSIMHNLIDQMLLSLKMQATVAQALEALRNNQKPVITVANTMGSFIQQYVEENGLRPGDAIGIAFNDLLDRYLERSRDVLEGSAFGEKTRRRLSDEELGPEGAAAFERVKDLIREADFGVMPISPIDYMKAELEKHGYQVNEITGRQHIIDYAGKVPVYRMRPAADIKIAGRLKSISGFNSGKIDVMILNQAGSTGLSLHASDKFKDQRQRHMIIAQAEKNIDTHMQMLGRVHRTGQVVPPVYSQMVADIPAEKRPAAVLARKMASLNANTTASRSSAMTAKDTPDFMNEYGDKVVASIMEDDPDLHWELGRPLPNNQNGDGLNSEDAIRKVTGRIPLLPLKKQEELYDLIESEYADYIQQMEAMGENALEAKTLDFGARTLKRSEIFEGSGSSPFAAPAYADVMDVKRLGKPYTSAKVRELVGDELKAAYAPVLDNPSDYSERLQKAAQRIAEIADSGDLDRIRDAFDGMNQKSVSDTWQAFRAYKHEVLDEVESDSKRKAQETRLDQMWAKWNTLYQMAIPGQKVKIGPFYGVVQKVARKGKANNPIAMGTWRVTVLLADAARQVQVPFSKLDLDLAAAGGTDAGRFLISRTESGFLGKDIMAMFDEGQSESREKRTILTGNLLAAYGKFTKGQIINFTDEAGNIQQGILMPRDFDLQKSLAEAPVIFPDAKNVLQFVDQFPSGAAYTTDGRFGVRQTGSGYRLSTPASKKEGARYFLNKDILDALGQDFVTSGQFMTANVDRATAYRVIQAVMAQGEQFQTETFKNEARSMLGIPNPAKESGVLQNIRPDMTERKAAMEELAATPAWDEKSDVDRVSALRELTRLDQQLEDGEINEYQYVGQAQALRRRLEAKRYAQDHNRLVSKRVRGASIIREKIEAAARKGEISNEAARLAKWLLDEDTGWEHLAEDLGLSIKTPKADQSGVAGFYNPASRVVTLLKDYAGANPFSKDNGDTIIHEIMHHTERMMPADVQAKIRETWFREMARARAQAVKAGNTELVTYFENVAQSLGGSRLAREAMIKQLMDGKVPYAVYQYVNPSEFWAVNATRILSGRYDAARGNWIAKAKRWLREFISQVKGIFGYGPDHAIIQGLQSVLDGTGEKIPSNDYTLADQLPSRFYQQFLNPKDTFKQQAQEFLGKGVNGAELSRRIEGEQQQLLNIFKRSTRGLDQQIEVLKRRENRDIDIIRRYFWTPEAAFRGKYPILEGLQKFATRIDLELSKTQKRLSQDFNDVIKGLSTEDFEKLSDLVWAGDAEAAEYSRDDLEKAGASEKVIEAYGKFRDLINKMGRLVDLHRRSMLPKYRQQKQAILKRMGQIRNIADPEFRKLYGQRARLMAKLRAGKGDPEQLAQQVHDLDQELNIQREGTDEYQRLAQELDRIDGILAQTSVRTRTGYAPHKFFGSYAVYRKVMAPVLDENGQQKLDNDGHPMEEEEHHLIAGEHGFYPTMDDALSAARQYAANHSDDQLLVRPVQFQFPNATASTLSDRSYQMLTMKMADALQLEGQELFDAMQGIARKRFRRRIAGFAQNRKGVEGYSKDMERVMRAHINEVTRYVFLDKLKYRAINDMEKMGMSPFRSSNQEHPTLSAMVEAYMRDINGQKQPLEQQLDELFDKPWAKPSLVAAGAGLAAALPAMTGVITSPAVGLALGSYVGYKTYRALARGGDFKTRALTASMMNDMTHLKLGAVFNLMSAVVNLSQTLINTMPVLKPAYTLKGMQLLESALRSKFTGNPNHLWRLLERADIVTRIGYTDYAGAVQQSYLGKASLYAFDKAENFNRAVAFLGAYQRAVDAGATPGEAYRQGERVMLKTQHNYGNSNKPELLRNILLRVPGQFKNFVAQQLSFTFDLGRDFASGRDKTALPLHLLSLFLVAGGIGVPGVTLLGALLHALFNFDPIDELKKAAIRLQAQGELGGTAIDVLLRGMPALFGEDMSERAGMGDKFLPTSKSDLAGPWWNTIQNEIRLGALNATLADHIKNVTPGIGKPLKSLEAAAGGMPLYDTPLELLKKMQGKPNVFSDGKVDYTNPWKGGGTEFNEKQLSTADLTRMALGSNPIKLSQMRDLTQMVKDERDTQTQKTKMYTNLVVQAVKRYQDPADKAKLDKALDNIVARIEADNKKTGFTLAPGAIPAGVRTAMTPSLLNTFKMAPAARKEELAPLALHLLGEDKASLAPETEAAQ